MSLHQYANAAHQTPQIEDLQHPWMPDPLDRVNTRPHHSWLQTDLPFFGRRTSAAASAGGPVPRRRRSSPGRTAPGRPNTRSGTTTSYIRRNTFPSQRSRNHPSPYEGLIPIQSIAPKNGPPSILRIRSCAGSGVRPSDSPRKVSRDRIWRSINKQGL